MQLPKDVLREMKEVGSSYKHLPSATDQAWITRWLGLEDGAVAYRHYHQPDSARHRLVWIRSQVLIAMLGLMGGLLGAGCVLFNMYVCRLRSRYGWSGPTWRGRLYIAMVPCDRSHNVFVFFPPYLWKVTNEETGCKGRKLIRETVVFPSFAGAAVPPYSCFPCNHAFL